MKINDNRKDSKDESIVLGIQERFSDSERRKERTSQAIFSRKDCEPQNLGCTKAWKKGGMNQLRDNDNKLIRI